MLNKNKMHLVPQIIIDCAEGLVKAKRANERDQYLIRLEAIRDYCDEAVKRAEEAKRKKVPDWKVARDYCS